MAEPMIYFWTDRAERCYATLRYDGGHWRLEWGFRDPPAGDNYQQQGEHVTSVREEALQWMLREIRAMCDDPEEPDRAERKLRAAFQEERV